MKFLKNIIALAIAVFAFSTLQAQTVDEIINKNIKAMGGLDKISAVKSMRVLGKISIQGMEIPFVQAFKRDNKTYNEATVQGMTQKQAFDGTTGWYISPFNGKTDPEVMSSDQAKMMKRSADFEGLMVNYAKKGSKVELLGKEDLDGSEVFKLKLTDSGGDITYFYVDAESGLLLKQTDKVKIDTKEVTSEIIYSNYKAVNDLVLPFSMEMRSPEAPAGQGQKLTIEKYDINFPCDDAMFQMPAAK